MHQLNPNLQEFLRGLGNLKTGQKLHVRITVWIAWLVNTFFSQLNTYRDSVTQVPRFNKE